jgi:hypothetical protein
MVRADVVLPGVSLPVRCRVVFNWIAFARIMTASTFDETRAHSGDLIDSPQSPI